jgi:hypothetical protein
MIRGVRWNNWQIKASTEQPFGIWRANCYSSAAIRRHVHTCQILGDTCERAVVHAIEGSVVTRKLGQLQVGASSQERVQVLSSIFLTNLERDHAFSCERRAPSRPFKEIALQLRLVDIRSCRHIGNPSDTSSYRLRKFFLRDVSATILSNIVQCVRA